MNSFIPIFNKHTKIYAEKLGKYSGKGSFNIVDNLKLCAMDMLCGKSNKTKARQNGTKLIKTFKLC